jgi:hypothetical protein
MIEKKRLAVPSKATETEKKVAKKEDSPQIIRQNESRDVIPTEMIEKKPPAVPSEAIKIEKTVEKTKDCPQIIRQNESRDAIPIEMIEKKPPAVPSKATETEKKVTEKEDFPQIIRQNENRDAIPTEKIEKKPPVALSIMIETEKKAEKKEDSPLIRKENRETKDQLEALIGIIFRTKRIITETTGEIGDLKKISLPLPWTDREKNANPPIWIRILYGKSFKGDAIPVVSFTVLKYFLLHGAKTEVRYD